MRFLGLVAGLLLLAIPVPACSSGVSTSTSNFWEPVEVISVMGPLKPFNPGGPTVEVVLKNVNNTPVYTLTANLSVGNAYTGLAFGPPPVSFEFTFGVSRSNLLLPGETTNASLTLIGGAFETGKLYPLRIDTGFINDLGQALTNSYTKQVQIVSPATT